MVDTSRHGIVSIHRIQCHSRQPLVRGSASTFLPLRSTPPSSLHNRLIIAMANERNIHWVRLRVNAPLTSLYPSWNRYVEDCAKGWRDGFVFRDIALIAANDHEATIPL
ncbi:hypothetical protein Scep_021910 [Stephania cephalantha]|uniref:Uncharacterized protein n=1 Tax=Stephania cephalantha TaxID=152367 RepID=A0AAP0F4B7_9MAGN